MKQKYEKPTIRDLGDVLPTAKGDCKAGNIASGGSGIQCQTFGSVASGAQCITGSTAGEGDCSAGTVASGNCNTFGETPNH